MYDRPPFAPLGTTPKSILVVEDDQVVRMLTVEVLEELGYRVFEAEDAPEALIILERDQPLDLLMTDIGLPGMSGHQLMTAAHQLRPRLPVLFASGYPADERLERDPAAPEVATITKPFSLELLRTTVRDMLERA
ncbi:MAG: response regulator [Pseudomonadota bacterium]